MNNSLISLGREAPAKIPLYIPFNLIIELLSNEFFVVEHGSPILKFNHNILSSLILYIYNTPHTLFRHTHTN